MSLEKIVSPEEEPHRRQNRGVSKNTTFMTMAYILAVNPGILGATGMDSGAVLQPPQCQLCLLLYVWHLWQTTHLYLHQVWA